MKVDIVFAKFTATWLQKWLKPLEDKNVYNVAIQEWGRVLFKLSDEQIIYAIEKCSIIYNFPPSISEFVSAALHIPSFSVVSCGGDGSDFYKNLMRSVDKYNMRQMSETEATFYLKDKYNALKEKYLLDFAGKK